jgi:hypothetical protein
VGQQDLNQHLEISSGVANETVCQTVANLTPGCPTTVCFWYTGRPGGQNGVPFDNAFTVTLSGAFALSETLSPAAFPAPAPATGGWYRYCTTFIPSGPTLTISFSRNPTTGDVGGAHIDNVSLTQCCDPNPCLAVACPIDKTVTCGTDWSFDPPTATSCCEGAVRIVSTGTVTTGVCPQVSTQTWLITDACGNTAECSQTVTVVDTTAPEITSIPTGGDLGCNPSNLPTNASIQAVVSATDNCGVPVVHVSHVDLSLGCAVRRTFTITARDTCGNTSLASTVLYTWIADLLPPEVECPADPIIVALNAGGQLEIPAIRPAASDNCTSSGALVYTQDPPAGTLVSGPCQPVLVSVRDTCGNVSRCEVRVCAPPDCDPGPNLVVNGSFEQPGSGSSTLPNGQVPGWNGYDGNCGSSIAANIELWRGAGLGVGQQDLNQHLEISSGVANETVCQTVANLTAGCPTTLCFWYTGRPGGQNGVPFDNAFTVSLSGAFALSTTLTPAPFPAPAPATGGWYRYCTTFTPSGPTLTISFSRNPTTGDVGGAHIDNVSLTQCCDPEPCITLACPEDIVMDCRDDSGALVNYSVPTAASACCPGPVTVTCEPPPGGLFPIGVTPVTCTAVDSCGNTTICTFTVTVRGHGAGQWSWAKRAGGDATDSGNAVAVDHEGNVFVTGSYMGAMNFPGSGVMPLSGFGGTDIFLAKYNRLGAFMWAVRAGGAGQDAGYGVAVDSQGNAFVTGAFSGTANFDSIQLTALGGRDVFVAKYDPNGALLCTALAGDKEDDFGSGIAVDGNGNAFVTGRWGMSGATQAFILKVSGANCNILGMVLSTGGSATGRGIAVDAAGDVYVTGGYSGAASFGACSVVAPAGFSRIFVARFNGTTLTCNWAQHSSGGTASGQHDATGIAVSGSRCYVTGYFNGQADFGGGILVANAKPNGLYDYLIAKFGLSGAPVWAIKGGGDPNADAETRGIAVDPDGNPCVTGFLHPNATSAFVNEGSTVLVASYNSAAGYLRWNRNAIDGTAGPTPNAPENIGLGIAVDGAGCVHVTGAFTEDLEFQPVATLNSIPTSARDMFVAKMCAMCDCDDNQNLLVNGSFEQPESGSSFVSNGQVPGWNGYDGNCGSSVAASIELWRGAGLAVGQQDLNQHLEISSDVASETVCQTVANLTPGCPATLCFWYTGRPGGQNGVPFNNAFTVNLSGAFALSATLSPAPFPAPAPATGGWYRYCTTFIPNGPTLTISLSRNPTPSDVGGAHIDNVSLTQGCCGSQEILAPVIIGQPLSQTATFGSDVTFGVTATGALPLSYQWRFDNANIPGATDATYTIFNAQVNNAGAYDVVVSNGHGSAASGPAILDLSLPPLHVALNGANLVLSWNSTAYHLQSAASLTLPIVWVDVPGTSPVTFPVSGPQRYFRLVRKPAGNYSANNPIKIMCIGDSITDDVAHNGAWRLYLEPLLKAGGYHFTFVGRKSTSLSAPNFCPAPDPLNQVNHEGYSGAVIAPPTGFGPHYLFDSSSGSGVVPDALLATVNAPPDLILMMIGTNDIGNGHDPTHAAMVDMNNLLTYIFSKAPNVNVIVAQIPTFGPGVYSAQASDVPVFNQQLAAVVNSRRTQGQNVFLADMHSAVSASNLPDGVHPDCVGLEKMAQEWLLQFQAIY